MAEIPDVATLTTISSDWGNDIRDRTVQRYSSVANRTTEHSAPSEGDLSYLEDSNTVWVYNGTAWVELLSGMIDTADITDGAVTTVKIADVNVTTAKIADEAVGFSQIETGSVLGSRLGDAGVLPAKLAGNITSAFETVGSVVVEGPSVIGSTLSTLFTVSLTIPANWGSWACEAYGQCLVTQSADSTSGPTERLVFQITIDGTANEFHTSQVGRQAFGGTFGQANSRLTVPYSSFRTGMTTTGTRLIGLSRSRGGLDNVYTMSNSVLTARAIRLT